MMIGMMLGPLTPEGSECIGWALVVLMVGFFGYLLIDKNGPPTKKKGT
jgi:hypothetical protein